MFGMFKKKQQADERFSQPLSPEADKFLAEALDEYGKKEEALEQEWHLSACEGYDLDDETALFKMSLTDGRVWEADAQILGSFNEEDQIWQWAWGNPDCAEIATRDSNIVREAGKRLDIWYLRELATHPMPGPEFVAYLCAIGMKASGSTGMFEACDGSTVYFVMLKNLRWTAGQSHSSAAVADNERPTLESTDSNRQDKTDQEDLGLLPAWIQQFACSEVYVISVDKDDPSKLLTIGPEDDKNYIALFTDRERLDQAVGDHGHVLFPMAINGHTLLKQARDKARGLIVNPTDESTSVALHPKMVRMFLEQLGPE